MSFLLNRWACWEKSLRASASPWPSSSSRLDYSASWSPKSVARTADPLSNIEPRSVVSTTDSHATESGPKNTFHIISFLVMRFFLVLYLDISKLLLFFWSLVILRERGKINFGKAYRSKNPFLRKWNASFGWQMIFFGNHVQISTMCDWLFFFCEKNESTQCCFLQSSDHFFFPFPAFFLFRNSFCPHCKLCHLFFFLLRDIGIQITSMHQQRDGICDRLVFGSILLNGLFPFNLSQTKCNQIGGGNGKLLQNLGWFWADN